MGVRVALAFALIVAVAGCDGGDPSPTEVPTVPPPSSVSAPPSTATTTTPAPSPTQTPPALPALAREDSPAGAESFARHWLATLDYAYKTGDTQPFRALGSCTGCVNLADDIQRLYVGGGEVRDGRLKVVETRVDRHVKSRAAAVELYYSRTQRIVIDDRGKQYVDRAASRLGFLMVLEWLQSRWQVERFPVLEK